MINLTFSHTSHPKQTSLTASDLLILAGLTITFYSLLYKTLENMLTPQKNYMDLTAMFNGLINTNIILVSVSILLILISTIGYPFAKLIGFYSLILSWIYNLTIILTALSATIIKSLFIRDLYKNIFDIIFIGIIILLILNYISISWYGHIFKI